jgi:hypothetical protein
VGTVHRLVQGGGTVDPATQALLAALPGYRLGSNVLRFAARDVDGYLEQRRRSTTHPEDTRRSGRGSYTPPMNDPIPRVSVA